MLLFVVSPVLMCSLNNNFAKIEIQSEIMQSVKHVIQIDSSIEKVYDALNTIEGLSSWWTTDTLGGEELGDALYFSFGKYATFEFQIALLDTNKLVNWKFVSGKPDWDGTYIAFLLTEKDDKVELEFIHEEFDDNYEGFSAINQTWELYLNSLKDYCETGKGQPFSE